MPELYLAVATLNHITGLAEDAAQNGFVVLSDVTITDSNKGNITTPIKGFYNDNQSLAVGIHDYLADSLTRAAGANTIDLYEITDHLDGTPHGPPVATDTWTLGPVGAGANTDIPEECALAVTIRGLGWDTKSIETPDSGDVGTARDRPRQRWTGRVYIGPLSSFGLMEEGTNFRSRPSSGFRTTVLDAAESLQDDLIANGCSWRVWSRKEALTFQVVRAEVDDAWDTQRRRGVAPTVRTARTIVP